MTDPDAPLHVGFTGTRHGMTIRQGSVAAGLLRDYDVVHHGDCVGGDWQAHEIALEAGLRTEVHPPKSGALRAYCKGDVMHEPKDYTERNHDIVEACCRLVAAPGTMSEELRSGTWATIRYARSVNKPVSIVFLDGSVQHVG